MFPGSNFTQMAAIMFGGDVLGFFPHAKSPAESSGCGSGSALAPALESRRGKCRNPSETMWNIWGMFSLTVSGNDSGGGTRGEAAVFHPESWPVINTKHAENIFVWVLKSHVGAYLREPGAVWQARRWLFRNVLFLFWTAGTLSGSPFFFCFLLLRLLPGAACLKREEGRNFRN